MNKTGKACGGTTRSQQHPFWRMPHLDIKTASCGEDYHPTDEDCFYLWQKYGMLDNICRHSLKVAQAAADMASRAAQLGIVDCVAATRSSGLLHDLAKAYCLKYGGSHAMLGAAWTVAETRDYSVAQGVMLHVHWPWELPEGTWICRLPLFVLYADKRVRHDSYVTLDERFEDLLARYGKTEKARLGIRESFEQSKKIEAALSASLKWDLHEYSFDSGWLVQRA